MHVVIDDITYFFLFNLHELIFKNRIFCTWFLFWNLQNVLLFPCKICICHLFGFQGSAFSLGWKMVIRHLQDRHTRKVTLYKLSVIQATAFYIIRAASDVHKVAGPLLLNAVSEVSKILSFWDPVFFFIKT